MPIRLTGEAGTGKTTICRQIAEELSLTFYTISCTKQMSVNALIGFISINGVYIPTQLRQAFENGGLFLLDELDAADPNVILVLNTIENGYMAFPDGVVTAHPSFRLVATTNPDSNHSIYTGRSKLDFATIDRYHTIHLDRDPELELYLTSQEVVDEITIARKVLESNSSSRQLTMRDAIRIYRLKALGISEAPIQDVVFVDDSIMYKEFTSQYTKVVREQKKASMTQSEASTIDELWDVIQREAATSTSSGDTDSSTPSRDVMLYVLYRFNHKGMPTPGYQIVQGPTAEYPYGGSISVIHAQSNTEMKFTTEEYTTYAKAQPDYMPF